MEDHSKEAEEVEMAEQTAVELMENDYQEMAEKLAKINKIIEDMQGQYD